MRLSGKNIRKKIHQLLVDVLKLWRMTCQTIHHLEIPHYLIGDLEFPEDPAELHLADQELNVVLVLRSVIR